MIGVDRHFGLDELVGATSRARMQSYVDCLVGHATALTGPGGHLVWGTLPEGAALRVPVTLELEPVGHLVAAVDDLPRLKAAAGMLGVVLRQRAQYLMASDLHIEAVQSDYEQLVAKHAALEASEQALRTLSGELERRVQDQVQLLEARQRQLYEAERLTSVGQLAAGVAHEINNPLGFIRSNLASSRQYVARLRRLQTALAGVGEPLAGVCREIDLEFVLEDFEALLADSLQGADRIARIVRDLKAFSNVDGAAEELIDVNDNLAVVCDMLAGQLPPGVTLHRALQPLPRLRGRPAHLNQLFFNVLRNAAQAVGERGTVGVSSGAADGTVRVEIADDGAGIAAEHLAHVFDPFFTTRPVGEGTGLGLTVARDVAQAHGGTIELASRRGSGTRVTITLPAVP